MPGNTIDGWIQRARNTAIGARRLVLTEIGFYPPNDPPGGRVAALQALTSSITGPNGLQNNSGIDAALLFNVFGRNQDPNFAGHVLSSGEISTVCNVSCGKIGANSAVYYSSPDSFYNSAQSNGMRFTLEIGTNNIPQIRDGINRALARGITPILRIGVGANTGGFSSPADYVSFINGLRSNFSGTIYLIVGPNEPNAECWATPQCGCGSGIPPGGIPGIPGIPGGVPGIPGSQVLSFDWPTDPAHFYVKEAGNEELIQTITSFISLTGQGQDIGIGWNPILPPPPDPANPIDLLNLPNYRQAIGYWAGQEIDNCTQNGGQPMYMSNYGCGPTSAAIVLSYLRGASIDPGTVNQTLPSNAIVCGTGTAYTPILRNLGASYTGISLTREAIATSVSQNRPMIIYCRYFGGGTLGWHSTYHISAIRGVSNVIVNGVSIDMLYFQDPILGRIAVSLDTVRDQWHCDNPTSVW
jgi:hypothetical protein